MWWGTGGEVHFGIFGRVLQLGSSNPTPFQAKACNFPVLFFSPFLSKFIPILRTTSFLGLFLFSFSRPSQFLNRRNALRTRTRLIFRAVHWKLSAPVSVKSIPVFTETKMVKIYTLFQTNDSKTIPYGAIPI